MQCNWSETHPVAHALVVVAAAMALAGIVETFIEAIAGGVAAMVVYGSVDRAYMGNMGLISTVITMVSHIVVLLLGSYSEEICGVSSMQEDLASLFFSGGVCWQ